MKDIRCQVSLCSERVVPWKNGLGFTRELFIDPPGVDFRVDPFQCRISSAAVNSGPSDFSLFPNHHRLLMMLDGSIRLKHGGGEFLTLPPLRWHEFDGAKQTKSEADQQLHDLNVIWSKDSGLRYVAQVVVAREAHVAEGDFVFVVEGRCDDGLDRLQLGRVVRAGLFGGSDVTFALISQS